MPFVEKKLEKVLRLMGNLKDLRLYGKGKAFVSNKFQNHYVLDTCPYVPAVCLGWSNFRDIQNIESNRPKIFLNTKKKATFQ